MYHKKIRFLFWLVIASSLLFPFNSISLAQSSARPPLKIVHLGDSYSAGNGARSASGARNYYQVSGCYRSPTNWGNQFTESLEDIYNPVYINRACSGAVIADIRNERILETRPKLPFASCPSPEYPDEEEWRQSSSVTCSRFIEPQINAIDESVDLVLMTVGGNDLGFATIVRDCFSLLKTPTACRSAVENARDEMEGPLKGDLINTFAAIKERLRPGAKIAYVSYPHLLLDSPYELELWNGPILLDRFDAGSEIRALSVIGEDTQKAAVRDANDAAGEEYIIFYDGTKALFSTHEPNPSNFRRNANRWIHEFEGTWMSEWYHPNPLGHENWARALSPFETFGATPGSLDTTSNIDVAFVVDTTGSMGGEIAQVRADLSSLVDQLAETTDSFRVAVVSYRDFPARTGSSGDYPYRVDQTFTDDLGLIQAAIDSLTASGGGDTPETVYSGIQASIGLPWRPGVSKLTIVIGDAPALSPEPISNLTAEQIVANSIAIDPVEVIGVNTGSLNSNGAIGQVANGTGGEVVQGTSGLTSIISEVLDEAANQPFAWMGQAYSGKVGQPILFDASGSYDPSGSPITLYEWDFDGDGLFDLGSGEATVTHLYDHAFDDFVVLRVTGAGGTALASARTVVNAEGFVSQGDEDSCELDENGYSIFVDADGRIIPCTADSLPLSGIDGVREVVGDSTGADTTGVFRPGNGVIFLKNTHASGFADIALNYGNPGDYPIVGDWDGDGDVTIGIYRNGMFFLRNENTVGIANTVFAFGQPGDQPIAGDWDGDGIDTIGIYRNGTFYLRNSNSAGAPFVTFNLGNPGDVAIAGDWDGDGMDTTGVFRPGNGVIYLKNINTSGFADLDLHYGIPGDRPVVGDWDNNGEVTIGIYRNGRFYLRNSNTIGIADIVFNLGNPGDMPIAGNWDGSIP